MWMSRQHTNMGAKLGKWRAPPMFEPDLRARYARWPRQPVSAVTTLSRIGHLIGSGKGRPRITIHNIPRCIKERRRRSMRVTRGLNSRPRTTGLKSNLGAEHHWTPPLSEFPWTPASRIRQMPHPGWARQPRRGNRARFWARFDQAIKDAGAPAPTTKKLDGDAINRKIDEQIRQLPPIEELVDQEIELRIRSSEPLYVGHYRRIETNWRGEPLDR